MKFQTLVGFKFLDDMQHPGSTTNGQKMSSNSLNIKFVD